MVTALQVVVLIAAAALGGAALDASVSRIAWFVVVVVVLTVVAVHAFKRSAVT